MAVEATNQLNNPLVDLRDLFPAASPCTNCCIPAHWTSPLTCQWLDQTSTSHVETQMLLLAGIMHRWLATFLDGDSHGLMSTKTLLEKRASLRQRIECSAHVAITSSTEAQAMYESCRRASLILLAAEKLSVSIRVAAKHVRVEPRLVECLRMTDLSNLWGVHKGLLFWVAAICNLDTAGRCFPLLSTTLLARFTQEIAISDYCSEIAVKPLRRLKQFESLCCHPAPMSQDIATHSRSPSQI